MISKIKKNNILKGLPANAPLAFGFLRIRTLPLLLAFAGLLTPALPHAAAEGAPPLMLAKVYQVGVPLADYWASEKLDGVRGYWDGEKLLTRGGERVAAPDWFTAGWPKVPMDGELWAGRGQFARAVSTVRQQTPDNKAWRAMRFMVFDLPGQGGPFNERIPALNGLVSQIDQPWVQTVAQFIVEMHVHCRFVNFHRLFSQVWIFSNFLNAQQS